MVPSRPVLIVPLVLAPLLLAGCVEDLGLSRRLDDLGVSRQLDVEVDRPRSLIERALAHCAARTEAGETDCVKRAVADDAKNVADLPRLIPGCRSGQLCGVEFTTEDRIGFLAATASDYRVRWRVTIDLRHPAKTIAEVPITAEQM